VEARAATYHNGNHEEEEKVSRSAGDALPEAVRRRLDGDELSSVVGFTVLLLTVDPEGWPRVAMLSAGEVLATSARTLRLALWPESATTANLTRSGRATLVLVEGGAGWYFLCSARRRADLMLPGRCLASFELRVEKALEDVVPYAQLTTGVTFHLTEPERTMATWAETLAALRSSPGS
jgi:hypothetical protein